MKIRLAAILIAAFVVPSFVLVSGAGADNPHPGTPPGQGGDPNASCGGGSGGKPANCNSPNLTYSDGCLHGQAPNQNPHCEGTTGTEPETPGTNPGTTTSGNTPSGAAEGGVAGTTAQGGANPANAANAKNQPAGQTARGGAGGKLAFTGLETLWLALLGGAMLATGLVLRARTGSSRSEGSL
jgi:hypothetical protein